MARAAEAREAAAAAVHPAHVELVDRLGLTAFESDVLLLAAAREFDPAVDVLCVAAGALGREPGPTFGLALRLFEQPAWDALSPERPLRRLHLLEPEGAGGLTTRVLRADERIVNYLKGLGHLDARLAETVLPLDDPNGVAELTASQLAAARTLRAGLRRAAADGRPPAVNLVGPDQVSKQLLAARVAAGLGRLLVRVPVGALPVQPDAAALAARLWERRRCWRRSPSTWTRARTAPSTAGAGGGRGAAVRPGARPGLPGQPRDLAAAGAGRPGGRRGRPDHRRAARGLGRGARSRPGGAGRRARGAVRPRPGGCRPGRPGGGRRRSGRAAGGTARTGGEPASRRPDRGSTGWPSGWRSAPAVRTSCCRRRSPSSWTGSATRCGTAPWCTRTGAWPGGPPGGSGSPRSSRGERHRQDHRGRGARP
ncbi:hypothetical protein ACFQ0M_09200 [Kitasatospora aburaviensis]